MNKILIVEDDSGTRNMLTTYFQSQGLEVLAARDGREGFQFASSNQTDVILLDVVLPYIDGFSLLQKLRAKGISTPIIMLTDCAEVDKKVKGLEYGADDYVTKPFSTRELYARVCVQLRKNEKTVPKKQQQTISIGSVTINPNGREVLAESTPIKLTKTEFDILLHLATHKNQVVTYSTLLEEVLGYQSAAVTKTVAMHITNLRKKLKQANIDCLQISAMAGVGYKLIEQV